MAFSKHEKPNKGATDVWLTPLEIVDSLGFFDLDPCGESFYNTAKKIYTENGLVNSWFGRIWLNPPYSEVGIWLDRLYDQTNHGCSGVALVFNRSDTKWFQKHIALCTSAFLPAGRIKFLTKNLDVKGNAGAPSIFLSYGETPNWDNLPMDGYKIK
jgi:hypothetical protein